MTSKSVNELAKTTTKVILAWVEVPRKRRS